MNEKILNKYEISITDIMNKFNIPDKSDEVKEVDIRRGLFDDFLLITIEKSSQKETEQDGKM